MVEGKSSLVYYRSMPTCTVTVQYSIRTKHNVQSVSERTVS